MRNVARPLRIDPRMPSALTRSGAGAPGSSVTHFSRILFFIDGIISSLAAFKKLLEK